jgi:hypothetical protein
LSVLLPAAARSSAARRKLARQHRHRRIVAQIVVVDQVFVAESNRKDPLPDQCRHLVLDQLRYTAVGKTRGKPLDQPNHPVRRTQQQPTCVRSDGAAVKPRYHPSPLDTCKTKQIRVTLRLHRVSPWP